MARIASPEDIHAAYGQRRPPSDERLDALVALHAELLAEAENLRYLGWGPAGGEAIKWTYPLDRERLRRFADYAYGGIGFETGTDHLGVKPEDAWSAPPIVKTPSAVLQAQKRTLGWIEMAVKEARADFPAHEIHWAALLHEPADIGGVFYELNTATPPVRVSYQAARVSFRAPKLATWFDGAPDTLMEIGGGHGRLARDCALLMPDTRLILTDLPFNLVVQARYLEEYFGDAVNLCLLKDQAFDPTARINLVAPWRLDQIPEPVEMAVNFLSFQHMNAANLDWYGAAMERLGVQHLYHQNRVGKRDSHDFGAADYPFLKAFDCVRREVTPFGTIVRPDGSQEPVEVVLELASRRP